MDLDKCIVIPEDLCTNPDMLMPFTESLISCAVAAISDLELPSKLFLMEGIVENVLKSFGFGKITSALFGVCKAVGGIMDTLDNLSLGILSTVIDPLKKAVVLLPLPDCSANSIKGSVKCGDRIKVSLPSSLKAKECFKHVKGTCNLIKANKGPALVDLFETINCLSEKAFDATTPEGITGLACSVMSGWAKNARILEGLPKLLPLPIPLLGIGGSSTSSSSPSQDDESKGLLSNVLDVVTDPLSILKPHGDSDSDKSTGLVSSVLDAVTNPLDMLTDPLSILKPNGDSDSDKPTGLVSSILDAVTNPLQGLGSQEDDSSADKPKGLVSSVLDAVTNPLSALDIQHDEDSAGDNEKPKGLISTALDALTPSHQQDDDSNDSDKPKGLISGMLDAITSPVLDLGSQTKDDSGSSEDSDKPQGLLSSVLGIGSKHDDDSKSQDTPESTSEDKQPHGLLSNLFGIVQPKPQTKNEQSKLTPEPGLQSDTEHNEPSNLETDQQGNPENEHGIEKSTNGQQVSKVETAAAKYSEPVIQKEQHSSQAQQGNQPSPTEKPTVEGPVETVQQQQSLLSDQVTQQASKPHEAPTELPPKSKPDAIAGNTMTEQPFQLKDNSNSDLLSSANENPDTTTASPQQYSISKSQSIQDVHDELEGTTQSPQSNEPESHTESPELIDTTTSEAPDVVTEPVTEPPANTKEKSKEKSKPKSLLSGLLGGLLG
ncbi:protein IWS1 homolog [Dermacentor albipictus]|uniref:protein IWS1 homolog n=1 Tax=Dermacentor albipictus TaxID=60249 RepID=UPI0038FC0C5F